MDAHQYPDDRPASRTVRPDARNLRATDLHRTRRAQRKKKMWTELRAPKCGGTVDARQPERPIYVAHVAPNMNNLKVPLTHAKLERRTYISHVDPNVRNVHRIFFRCGSQHVGDQINKHGCAYKRRRNGLFDARYLHSGGGRDFQAVVNREVV